ncbi:hypothetical protein DEDE109153_15820 [Deinococcus deserti]|uniref:hypothetical protein n=1 Tax=Deinococcus deserti TaxID=310783 RepID=UPI0003157254|nr:hypothetical protein [Deinococcus deserti]
MPGLLLTRVISTAQTLAHDLGDQALLGRLAQLQQRAHLERTEDVHQLLSELLSINAALGISGNEAVVKSYGWTLP